MRRVAAASVTRSVWSSAQCRTRRSAPRRRRDRSAPSEWSASDATSIVSWLAWPVSGRIVITPLRRAVAAGRFPGRSAVSRSASAAVSAKSRARGAARLLAHRRGERQEVGVQRGAVGTGSPPVVRRGTLRRARVAVEQRGDQQRVVLVVVGSAVSHGTAPSGPRGASRKRQPPAVDPRLDGAERDPGHLGDLGVVVALDVVEDDRRALVVGDRGQRVGQGARPFRSSAASAPGRPRRRPAAASSRPRARGRAGPAGACERAGCPSRR